MTVKLSCEQQEALKQHEGHPLRVWDDTGNVCYVLVPADAYERLRSLFEDEEFDVRESYPSAEDVFGAAGWDDAAMDDYNDYDAHRRQK